MRPSLLTDTLEIDRQSVQRAAVTMARSEADGQRRRHGKLLRPYSEIMRASLRWAEERSAEDQRLAKERARLARMTATEREIEDLLWWRDRLSNPLTRPTEYGITVGGDTDKFTAELARIDARLSALTQKDAA